MFFLFFFNDTATTEIYTLSLHDALPIFRPLVAASLAAAAASAAGLVLLVAPGVIVYLGLVFVGPIVVLEGISPARSEEHTSELQSRLHLVCRLLLEKKKKKHKKCYI